MTHCILTLRRRFWSYLFNLADARLARVNRESLRRLRLGARLRHITDFSSPHDTHAPK